MFYPCFTDETRSIILDCCHLENMVMTKHMWSITQGSFVPEMSSSEKHGQVIITTFNQDELVKDLVKDHQHRSPLSRDLIDDYRVEAFTDEMRIYVRSGKRWRTLLNLQYEREYNAG